MRARALLFVPVLLVPAACSENSPAEAVPPPPPTYTIGGTVAGLAGTGLVLMNDFADSTAVTNGAFRFATARVSGTLYAVRVAAQPVQPDQTCTVENGTGLIASADVTDVEVTCVTPLDNEDLDPGFDEDGRATADLVDGVHDMAVLTDGRIVVINAFDVARFHATGGIDASFGSGGVAHVEFPGTVDRLHAIAVQPDGRLVIAGSTQFNNIPAAALIRLHPDGSVDTSFGANGTVTKEGTRSSANDVLIQPDGRIVTGGSFVKPDGDSDFVLFRFLPDGSPDPDFGTDGAAIVDMGGKAEIPSAIALQADGRLLITGRVGESGGADPDIGVARFLADGTLDPDFGIGGVTGTSTPDFWDEPRDMVVQPDGRIVLAGVFDVRGPSSSRFLVIRLNPDGTLDHGFGDLGYAEWAVFSDENDAANALALQPDGRIVVVGQKAAYGSSDFAIARYLPNGTLDPDFGENGLSAVDFFGSTDFARTVAITADGGILVGGMAREGNVTRVALAKLRP
jgi:uncharacterized delta-60 repeat protein